MKYVIEKLKYIRHYFHTNMHLIDRFVVKSSRPPVYAGNSVINHPALDNAKIVFNGKANILYCEKNIILRNSNIKFSGDNAVIYLSSKKGVYGNVHIEVSYNSVVFIGRNTRFTKGKEFITYIQALEQGNVIVGDDCMFSINCWLKTSDSHAIYNYNSRKRINPSKSILIGDHVWIGQNVTILKGSQIGSGSIIGAGTVATGKPMKSNTAYGGNPAKAIKEGLFFARKSINHTTAKNETYLPDDDQSWLYSYDASSTLSLERIDKALSSVTSSEAKLTYIKKYIAGNPHKNRFYIGEEKPEAN